MSVVFGYRHVENIPLCPCADPGNYVALETDEAGDLLRCWCGRTMRVSWDSPEERAEFIAANMLQEARPPRRAETVYTLVCTSCCAGWPTSVDHGECKWCGGELELRGVVRVFDLKP